MKLSDVEFAEIFPFKKPRKNQRETIEQILTEFIDNNKKYVIFCGPTGTGKSVIGYAIAKYFNTVYPRHNISFDNNGTFVLTSQKCLQEQYFKELDVPFVLGKSNYKCAKNNDLTCEMGACKDIPKNKCQNCPYIQQREFVMSNWIGNMNYSYYLQLASLCNENNSENHVLPKRSLLIMDEVHNLESELLKLGELKLSEKILQYLGINDLKLPLVTDTEKAKIEWLTYSIKNQILNLKNYLKIQIENFKSFKISKEQQQYIFKLSLVNRICKVIEEVERQYNNKSKIIIHSEPDFIMYKTLFAHSFFKSYINYNAEYMLFMSATVLNKEAFCKDIGINPNDAVYIASDSLFPIENRLIHFTPVGSLSYKEKELTMPKLVSEVKKIMKKYPNEKGIIHTVNYSIASTIISKLQNTKLGERLLMPQGSTRQETLDKFMESNYPYVLISPSLTEGLDLKDDLSRFCIICKMPYASLGDEWVKARLSINQKWYINKACETLVQMTGRSVRNENDYCDTYILDNDFLKLATSGEKIFPDWWKDSVIEN